MNFIFTNQSIESYKLNDPQTINYIKTISNPRNLIILENTMKSEITIPYFTYGLKDYSFSNFNIGLKNLNYDTKENRFVKYVLNLISREFDSEIIIKIFKDFNRVNNLLEHQSNISEEIHFLERRDVKEIQKIPYNSQVLQKNSYYRKFLEYFIWLQSPTVFNIDNLFTIDVKPMDLLYEYYCLFIMKKALDSIAKNSSHIISIPEEEDIEIIDRKDVKEYRAIKYIKFNYKIDEENLLQLIYRPNKVEIIKDYLRSYSTKKMQKPDFLIVKINKKKSIVCADKINLNQKLMVLIDAKYRPNSDDLWNIIHSYKDRLLAKGALFINPLVEEKTQHFGKILPDNKENTSGFVAAIKLLGLKSSEDYSIESQIEEVTKILKEILEKYFLDVNDLLL